MKIRDRKKDIDPRLVENLAKIGCTYAEMAAVLDCDESTLQHKHGASVRKGREQLKMSIRRMQLQKANEGDSAMITAVAKQYGIG